MKKGFGLIVVLTFLLLISGSVLASPGYLSSFNSTYGTSGTFLDSCNVCHTNVPSRNPYGTAYADNGHNFANIESMDSDNDGFSNIAEINALTFPGDPNSTPTPAQCTYTYSDWGECQPDGTQTRTVISSSPSGCVGTPVLSQSCTYTPPPPPPPAQCTYTYSDWGECQPDGTQTRTVISSSPSGCVGTPVLSQSCTYTPPPPPSPGECTYTYSDWGECQPDGTQTRTVISSSPEGCTGTPVLTQFCNYTPPTPPAPPTTGDVMPVPTGREVFTYDPVPLPETSGDPAAAKPLGVGPIANGEGVLDIKVMAQFDGPVDVSVSVYAPAVDEMDVFFLDPQKKLKRLSKELFDSNMYGPSDREGSSHDDNEHRNADIRRLLYWKKGVTELNETLFTRPASELPSGIYSLILTVRNSDDNHSHSREYSFYSDDDSERRESEDGSYRWITHFVIP